MADEKKDEKLPPAATPAPVGPINPASAGTDKPSVAAAPVGVPAAKAPEAKKLSDTPQGADAVARAAHLAIDAALKSVNAEQPTERPVLVMVGSPGGKFHIKGRGDAESSFGASGTVKCGGRDLGIRSWSTTDINGFLPADIVGGADVEVHVSEGVVRKGKFVA